MMKTPRLAELLALMKAEDERNAVTYDYDALTPLVINEKDARHYLEALNFACHRSDIQNIAVTGPYGSGKSSVLLTWAKKRTDLSIMTVSLADFDMLKTADPMQDKPSETSVKSERKARKEEKSLEYSVLQQILYKAKKNELPYSRIERIADIVPVQIFKMALNLFTTVGTGLIGLFLLFPKYYGTKLSLTVEFINTVLNIPSIIRIGSAALPLLITFYLILGKLHKIGLFDRRISIDKIDISKGATISSRPSEPSLLNVFIDEIVYFFEKKKYNVVIFEDLDRHNDGSIFIKLREINQIINNCLPAERPVRFIYAVRDDIFNSPESRTKFFDFIMPVIPVMDSQNATEHFSSKFKKTELDTLGFSQCVARIAIFIPDMRLLNSIANEFRLYKKSVNNGENIIRLLSLIAYKNICTRDYHLIDSKQGILYGVMAAHVSGKLKEIFEEQYDEELFNLNVHKNKITDETENGEAGIIRDILQVYISDITKQNLVFSNQNGESFKLDDLMNNDELFVSMMESSGLYVRSADNRTRVVNISSSETNDILNQYRNRCDLLTEKNDGKLHEIYRKITQLEKNKRRLQVSSPAVLLENMGSDRFREWIKDNLGIACNDNSTDGYDSSQLDFIFSLLRWDYLSTDYMAYRSVFIPGSLSSIDNEFIRALSAGKAVEHTSSMPLDKTENVIKKLKELGLLFHDGAWHAGVLLYLLQHDKYTLKRIIMLQLEDNEEQRLLQLVNNIFEKWKVEDCLIYINLMASDTGMANQLLERLFNIRDQRSALDMLIFYFISSNLHWDSDTNTMRFYAEQVMAGYGNIPDLIPDGYGDVFIKNLRESSVKLKIVEPCSSEQSKKIVSGLVKHQLWQYSGKNIESLVYMLSGSNDDIVEQFRKNPLTVVKDIRSERFYNTIMENIDKFIVDFFIGSQDFNMIPEVLNYRSVGFDTLMKIIKDMDFIIDDIESIKNRAGNISELNKFYIAGNLYSLLLNDNRITPSWKNVIYLCNHDNDFNPELCLWFDRHHTEFDNSEISLNQDNYEKVFEQLFNSGVVSKEGRKKVLDNIRISLLLIPEYISIESAALLLDEHRLAPSLKNFKDIEKRFVDEGNKVIPLLFNIVIRNPSLLQSDAEIILTSNGIFNILLVEQLLGDHGLSVSDRIYVLNWLWNFNPALFDSPLFIPPDSLRELASGLADDDLRLALLTQCLNEGSVSHSTITLVLSLLNDADYQVFLSDKAHRSMAYTAPLGKMAQLLMSARYIKSLKINETQQRLRFIPHNSQVFLHS
jgi:hypothetical protein